MSKKGSRQSLAELESLDLDHELEEFPIGLGCALDMFREKDEVFEILNSLPEIYTSQKAVEVKYETYGKIMDRYQEQPHLIDHHLEAMINVLLSQFRDSNSKPEQVILKHLSLQFLRRLFKVRGPKEVVKRLPHEIADLVPVLNYLENENLDDPCTWESGYVLVMWLSILVINPFHLKLLDGQEEERKNGLTIAQRLMKVCKKCIVLNNNVGTAAPFLISRFLTRPDMQEIYMDNFIEWTCMRLPEPMAFGTRVGAFAALSAIFKQAKRQEILKYGEQVLKAVLFSKYEKCDTVLRKAGTKLIQRIGMMFMKTKMAPWRYQRGSRSLLCNLKGTTNLSETAGSSDLKNLEGNEQANYDELNQYSGAIESVIDKLLEGLKDKDTVVRWSSAKGIGRVTNRLPKEYADEVMEGILQNFSPREGNAAWHGGCLALAELARRGLLLPERIPTVIPVLKRAMVYDEIRGNFSVGSHVRDAACYVLWAFARAFEPHIIEPHVNDIAACLIITMTFDREVNCRRAASAAFQENVGRQGNFPHGIDIVTVADYFAVGIRTNAFTKVSVEIGKFQIYTTAMIDHLMKLKFNHFDEAVRELTAEALGNLALMEPLYVTEKVVPALISFCTDSDTYTSHGALISLGAVLVKLKSIDRLKFSNDILSAISEIVPKIVEKKFANSARGNEFIRLGLNEFIDSCSLSKMPYHNDENFITVCHKLLEEHLSSVENRTRTSAGKAFAHFVVEYYHNNPAKQKCLAGILEGMCKELTSNVMPVRQGHAHALGRLPVSVLKENFVHVITALLKCSTITADTVLWAESRRDALVALSSIFIHKKFTKNSSWEAGIPLELLNSEQILNSLLESIEDYTTDKRGDIGCWVRKSSITTLKIFSIRLNECGSFRDVDPSCISKIMGLIAKQCVEKIDNVRVHAGQAFATIIHQKDPEMLDIPHRDAILRIFPEDFCRSVNWRSTTSTFPKFVEMLTLEHYTYYLLEGFIISGGSLSDSVMKDANGAITNYLVAAGAMGDAELNRIGQVMIKIFENNLRMDRVTVPLMKFVTQLLQSGTFLPLLTDGSDAFGLALMELTKNELFKSGRVEKLVLGVELLCEMLQGSLAVIRSAMKKLTVYLAHAYPRVRVITSQKIYEALLTYGAEELASQEEVEKVMTLLQESQWEGDANAVRPIRNQICTIFNIPQPISLKPPSA